MTASRILSAVIVILLLWTAGLFGYVRHIEALDAHGRQTLQSAPNQSIVVLTGGDQRIAAGLRLLQQGIAPEMFISGVGTGVRLQDILPELPEELARRIVLGRKASDTLGNAHEVADWLQSAGDAPRVVLVSGHYHLPRALGYLKWRMPEVRWIPIAAHPQALPLADWYRYPLGWRLLSSEMAKFLGAKLVQGIQS